MRRTVGIIIEGVNAPASGSYYDGIVWHYGPAPTDALTGYLWVEALTQVPQTISESVQPVSGKLSGSVSNYQITRTADSALYLLGRELRTTVALTADYTPGDGQVELNTTGLTGLIWIDDECMQLSTESPAGTYAVFPAIAETEAQFHYSGTVVWRKNPYLWRRRYRLVEYDWDSGTLRTIARGHLDSLTESMTGVIDITTMSLPTLISGAMLNKNAKKLTAFGRVHPAGLVVGEVNAQNGIIRTIGAGEPMAVQCAGTVALAVRGAANRSFIYAIGSSRNMPPMGLPMPELEDDNTFFDDEARELFVVHAVQASSSSRILGASNWRNRLALAYGFLRSGSGTSDLSFDSWKGTWGVGLKAADFDNSEISALVKAVSPDVDQLILGADGDEVAVEELLTSVLLLPGGWHLATKEDGRITLAALRVPSFDDMTDAPTVTAIEPRLDVDWQIQDQVAGVTAEIGGTPYTDPDVISISLQDRRRTDTARRAMYESDAQFPIDYQTYAKDRDGLLPEVFDRLALARRGPPVIGIRALPLDGDTYDLGRWYRLSIPIADWWVISGVQTEPTEAQSLGYLVGRKYNIAEGTYDLDFISHAQDGRTARLRAPTGIVRNGGTGATIDVEIAHGLTAGEIVDLCDSSGAEVSGPYEVLSVTSLTVTLDTSITVTVGQILRLALLSEYTVDPRRWAYIADATDELILDTEPADIYG